jgi:hypothetical protein
MTDGLGNAVGGLLGLAILANVAGNVMKGPPRTRTVYKTVYRTRPVTLRKKKRKVNHFGL